MATEDRTARSPGPLVPLGDGTWGALSVPETANSEECAAVAAAIGAHLTDRHRAADADGRPPVDRWKLAGRLGLRDADRLPRGVTCGEEWKAAGRTWQ